MGAKTSQHEILFQYGPALSPFKMTITAPITFEELIKKALKQHPLKKHSPANLYCVGFPGDQPNQQMACIFLYSSWTVPINVLNFAQQQPLYIIKQWEMYPPTQKVCIPVSSKTKMVKCKHLLKSQIKAQKNNFCNECGIKYLVTSANFFYYCQPCKLYYCRSCAERKLISYPNQLIK